MHPSSGRAGRKPRCGSPGSTVKRRRSVAGGTGLAKEQALGLPVENGNTAHASEPPRSWAAKNAWFVEIGDTRHQLGKQSRERQARLKSGA